MIGIGMKRFGMRVWVCLLVAFAIGGAALAQTPSPNEKKTISITWLGHAAFEIVSPGWTHLSMIRSSLKIRRHRRKTKI